MYILIFLQTVGDDACRFLALNNIANIPFYVHPRTLDIEPEKDPFEIRNII